MNTLVENPSHQYFSVENLLGAATEDKNLKTRLFDDLQSLIDDDLSEKACNSFAESYGLVAKIIDGEWIDLCNRNYPSIVKLKDGRYFLVLRANDSGILLYDHQNSRSSIVTKDLFQTRWTGHAVTFCHEAKV